MADTGARTLRMLSLLQARPHWPGTELADRLGVSVRTLRRDVERLRELGYPVDARRGAAGGYQLAAGAALPPLVLDDEEAVALVVGLQSATQAPVAGTAEASLRALTKVVQVLPPRLRRRVEAVRAVTVPGALETGPLLAPEVLTAVALACRDGERVRFAHDGGLPERHVEPHRLVPLGQRWYLVAYDLARAGWRTFRLDRIRDVRPTGSRFAPRPLPAQDAAAFVRDAVAGARTGVEVEAFVRAGADGVRRRLGRWAEVADAGDGGCVVRMRADDLVWPAVVLASLGAEFEVAAPAELRERLRELAGRLARASGAGTGAQGAGTGAPGRPGPAQSRPRRSSSSR
ncbi:YafY family protein [Kineococcus glutinatus]|uniref:helix-turn-helix transcriptional regulator n=1 Tax=Kineococcus glutinatus TaxID=1070872 RepID=UPI0031E5ED29